MLLWPGLLHIASHVPAASNPEVPFAEPLFPSLQTWGAGLLLSAQSAGCLKVILIALDDTVS